MDLNHNIFNKLYNNSMQVNCQNCEHLMEEYLCNLPYQWRKQIAKAICVSISEQQSLSCSDITKCETLTSLSAFTITGDTICITYKDENKQSFERCFSLQELQNSTLNQVDPKCVADINAWLLMTYEEKIQAIIDFACLCTEGGR